MGLLDDAIREHLELKRRSGADPGDVARQEDEVFGEHVGAPEQPAGESVDPEPPADHRPVAESDPGVHVAADVLDDGEGPEPPVDAGQQTRQFTALEREDAERPPAREQAQPAPAEDEAVHDELEDTPDFLQETPEHDRLWFEQKPPRDFDF